MLSIRCSLAFTPYVVETTSEFLDAGVVSSRVVRQGGSGLIVRSEGDIVLRHQNRQAQLGREEARHYAATVSFRHEFYQVVRMEDEVVLANVGSELLLSHPQSDLWLSRQAVAALLKTFDGRSNSTAPEGLPEWLTVSASVGRLLISDQRNARWVLLGEDHLQEIERRMALLELPRGAALPPQPPTISLKGVTVHLQSAEKLAGTLEEFAQTRRFESFVDRAPEFSLAAREATEGIEITDNNKRVGLTVKEARKWAEIIRIELARLNSSCLSRGQIRTVFADAEQGRWILQWGDEVLLGAQASLPAGSSEPFRPALSGVETQLSQGTLETKRTGDLVLLLSPTGGACVALDASELTRL
ncbi:MAG TPA: hypothetical protein VN937_08090 [Blastocatellia bacterium]|nr:hypothetical protein [Blastocatellia bacterium]